MGDDPFAKCLSELQVLATIEVLIQLARVTHL